MGNPIEKIDLHGCTQDEAIKIIERALKKATSGTYQIQLIHGFHRGANLKNMIRDEYQYDDRIKRIMPGDNPGITILVLREI